MANGQQQLRVEPQEQKVPQSRETYLYHPLRRRHNS